MKKYEKAKINFIEIAADDVILTSSDPSPETLITWGTMTENVDSKNGNVFD